MDASRPTVRPPRLWVHLPWILFALALLGFAWMGLRHATLEQQNSLLRQQLELSELSLRATQAQYEAERLLAAKLAADLKAATEPKQLP